MKTLFTFLVAICFVSLSYGQYNSGDFQTTTNGNWENAGWETWIGFWWPAPGVPSGSLNDDVDYYIQNDITLDGSTTSIVLGSSTGLIINGSLTVSPTGSIDATNGTLTNNAGNSGIVLESTSSGSAQLLPTASVNVTREIYLSGSVWHLIGSSVDGASTNAFTGCWMQQYNTSTDTWTWNDEPGFDNTMGRGYGYSIYSSSSATYSIGGTVAASSASPTLSNTGNGYNLISNPFTCGLRWNSSHTRTNVDSDINVWISGSGSYSLIGISAGYILPASQGFFVKTNGAVPSITLVPGNMTVSSNANVEKNTSNEVDYFKVNVNNLANDYRDAVKIAFKEEGSENYSYALDLKKLYGIEASPDLYLMSQDGQDLVRKTLPLNLTAPLQLSLRSQVDADYEISLSDNQLSFETDIYLEDLFEGQTVLLDDETTYTFSSSAGDAENRFVLHFDGITGVNEQVNNDFAIFSSYSNLIIQAKSKLEYSIQVVNLLGQEVYTSSNLSGDQRINLSEYQNDVLIVNLITETGTVSEKVLIK